MNNIVELEQLRKSQLMNLIKARHFLYKMNNMPLIDVYHVLTVVNYYNKVSQDYNKVCQRIKELRQIEAECILSAVNNY